MSLKDLQTQTSIDLNKNIITEDDINTLLRSIQSELIFDIEYNKDKNHYIIIEENKLIENFFNGNSRIDDLLINNISAKNRFVNKNLINETQFNKKYLQISRFQQS